MVQLSKDVGLLFTNLVVAPLVIGKTLVVVKWPVCVGPRMVAMSFVRLIVVVDDLFVEAWGVEGTHAREVATVLVVYVALWRRRRAKNCIRIA